MTSSRAAGIYPAVPDGRLTDRPDTHEAPDDAPGRGELSLDVPAENPRRN